MEGKHALYESREWKKVRETHLKRHPYCVICAQIGIRTRASEVDHIEPVRFGGFRFSPINLQSMCISHHSQKTARGIEHGSFRSFQPFMVVDQDGFAVPAGVVPESYKERGNGDE